MTEDKNRAACDDAVAMVMRHMVGTVGVSIEMACDRMLTYVAAQAVTMDGSANTAAVFRDLADKIEGGVFKHLDPERPSISN